MSDTASDGESFRPQAPSSRGGRARGGPAPDRVSVNMPSGGPLKTSPKWRRPSYGSEGRGPGLVEKAPVAVPAGRVVRLLARGEKLDP